MLYNTTMDILKALHIDKQKAVGVASNGVYALFRVLEKMIEIRNINYPEQEQNVIFAMWHAKQCSLHGIPYEKRKNVNILISRSDDGEIIARVVQKWGFNTVRGSKDNKGDRRKGGIQATLQMIDRLKEGQNVAIMVDGPAGPYHEIKNGVIKVAKKTGAAIIPMTWYSPNKSLLKLPTWDNFEIPMGFTKFVNLYGEPIYISEDADVEEDIRVKQKLKEALLELDKKASEAFKEAYKKQK